MPKPRSSCVRAVADVHADLEAGRVAPSRFSEMSCGRNQAPVSARRLRGDPIGKPTWTGGGEAEALFDARQPHLSVQREDSRCPADRRRADVVGVPLWTDVLRLTRSSSGWNRHVWTRRRQCCRCRSWKATVHCEGVTNQGRTPWPGLWRSDTVARDAVPPALPFRIEPLGDALSDVRMMLRP